MQRLNGTIAALLPPADQIPLEKLILLPLGDAPQMAAGAHGHVDDAGGPDIDGAGIELAIDILLGGDVGRTAAQARRHVGLLLPGHAEALAVAEIGDLEGAPGRQQQVLGLEVAVGDAHLVHVLDPAHQLLEVAVGLDHVEPAGRQHQRVQIPAGAEFHDLAVVALGVLQQVEGVDDVGVPQRRGDAEFRRQALLVLLGRFLRPAPEFLDRVELLAFAVVRVRLVRDAHDAEGAPADDFLAFAVLFHQRVRARGSAFLVRREFLPLVLELVHPGGHQRQLGVLVGAGGVVSALADEHVAEHVGKLLLPFGALQLVFVGAVGVEDEALGLVVGVFAVAVSFGCGYALFPVGFGSFVVAVGGLARGCFGLSG